MHGLSYRTLGIILGGIALVLLLGVGVYSLLKGEDKDATISGFSWERSIELEALRTFTEEDWSVPPGGRVLSSRTEIHHYDRVIVGHETKYRTVNDRVKVGSESYVCGKEDLGNGRFRDKTCTRDKYENRSRQESYQEPIYQSVPNYQRKYTYHVDRWVHSRSIRNSGPDKDPRWGDFGLESDEREKERSEKYVVHAVGGDGKQYSFAAPLTNWASYQPGHSLTITVNRLGLVTVKK